MRLRKHFNIAFFGTLNDKWYAGHQNIVFYKKKCEYIIINDFKLENEMKIYFE